MEEKHHQDADEHGKADIAKDTLSYLVTLEAQGAQGEEEDVFAPVQPKDQRYVEEIAVGSLTDQGAQGFERKDLAEIRDKQGDQRIADRRQGKQGGRSDDTGDQQQGEGLLQGRSRQGDPVGPFPAVGHAAVHPGAKRQSDDDHYDVGPDSGGLVRRDVLPENEGQQIAENKPDEGPEAEDEHRQAECGNRTAHIVGEVLSEAVDVKYLFHGGLFL